MARTMVSVSVEPARFNISAAVRIKPIYRGKEVVAIQGILSDISHHKQAQSALQRSEDTLKSIFLAAPIGIGLTSQRILQEVNQRIC